MVSVGVKQQPTRTSQYNYGFCGCKATTNKNKPYIIKVSVDVKHHDYFYIKKLILIFI